MFWLFGFFLALAIVFSVGANMAANSDEPGDTRYGNAVVCIAIAAASGLVAFTLLIIAAFT
jgi:hypothetical protein